MTLPLPRLRKEKRALLCLREAMTTTQLRPTAAIPKETSRGPKARLKALMETVRTGGVPKEVTGRLRVSLRRRSKRTKKRKPSFWSGCHHFESTETSDLELPQVPPLAGPHPPEARPLSRKRTR